MVVGVDAVAAGARRQGRAGAAGASRREAGRGLLASVAALALAPVAAASRSDPPAQAQGGGSFDETHRGRRIQGALVPVAGRGAAEGDWRITVDGRPLHLMRRADGTWLSMVDHYTSYRTPLEATRAAVDEMGPGQRLREPASAPMAGAHQGHRTGCRMGGSDGVRA
ncbi:tyrosinase family oxidase copper chaperone [Streptomyces camelliae]|uniref:Tyrosinase family oxidase copper chaperone n=1 Tax=Streptomyces camelliae TaxID=3004093 RepID=A0ABY7P9F6_9ACTN|nr:tyrosinase family oxidase copper chaperone [Streptomyces sp. HUAS 2-6]WBO66257.1 tyrosinase family oxidase copper chaperone [Streptomyces sp. HUAS 2-6]